MIAALLAAITLFGAAPSQTKLVRSVDTSSDKAVAVVTDPRFDDHEPGAISERALAHAMRNIGLFSDEDIADMAGPIAAEMAKMEPREQIRIVTWSQDGARKTYLYVHDHALYAAYYRGKMEIDREHARLPSSQAATEIQAKPTPTPKGGVMVKAEPTPHRTDTKLAMADSMGPLSEDEAREKLTELETLRNQGKITPAEYKQRRKEILNRL